ncbi:MAG: filamentous hemagglutinin N-terminal domain-containing protein [Cyanobacteria bacterium J06634_5]
MNRPSQDSPVASSLKFAGQLGIGLTTTFGLMTGSAIAQISPDLSTNTTLSTTAGPTCPGICITGGSRSNNTGANIFHSFSSFNIGNGETVTFNNEPGVSNIFSRVTGISPLNASNIDGTLSVNGPANLFLLNPNGIVFGKAAALNIQGSFLASTAESLLFENGQQFRANTTDFEQSLLTVSAPIGLQFGSSPTPIAVNGDGHNLIYSSRSITRRSPSSQLQVSTGENLALIGGDINLQGGNLIAPNGYVEVASIGENGQIPFNINNEQWQFDYSQISDFQDISIAQDASIDVSAADAGVISLQGNQITLQEGSALLAQITGNGSGNIDINATTGLQVIGANVRRRTNGSPTMPTSIFIEVAPTGTGTNSSLLTVNAPQIDLSDGAQIGLTMAGQGEAGNINILSQRINSDGISNVGPSSIFTTVAPLHNTSSDAAGGDLTITATEQFNITGGSQIAANTFGPGSGGNLIINPQIETAGNISITGFATRSNGASVPSLLATSSQTGPSDSLGRPGTTPLLILDDQGSPTGSGRSGSATINARNVVVAEGGQITTGTNSNNAAGHLTITATDSVELSGQTSDGRSGILSGAREGSGAGGDIAVSTPLLSVLNGATINTSNFPSSSNSSRNQGTGSAGNITLNTQSTIVKDDSVITADTVAGDRANITIQTEDIILRNNSRITTNATGSAAGGNINIQADALIALENSDITANAEDNFGGRITINAGTILGTAYREQLTDESDITATSALGPAFSGSVELNTPQEDPTNGLTTLPKNPIGKEKIVAACEQLDSNTFVTTGRGGVPADSSRLITGDSTWSDFRLLPGTQMNSEQQSGSSLQNKENPEFSSRLKNGDHNTTDVTTAHPQSIVEAQNWFTNDNGQTVLAASASSSQALPPNTSCLGQR